MTWNVLFRILRVCVVLSATEIQELLAAVNGVAVKSSDKNTRTRALWVISKQAFPPEVVKKEVSFCTFLVVASFLTERRIQKLLKSSWVSSFFFYWPRQTLGHSPLSSCWIWRLFPIKFDSQVSIVGKPEPEITAFLEEGAAMWAILLESSETAQRRKVMNIPV